MQMRAAGQLRQTAHWLGSRAQRVLRTEFPLVLVICMISLQFGLPDV